MSYLIKFFTKVKIKILYLYSIFSTYPNRDTWEEIDECDVLLICNDADKSFLLNRQYYSHLLDSIGDLYSKRNLRFSRFTHGYSRYRDYETYSSYKTANRYFIWIFIFSLIIRPFNKYWLFNKQVNFYIQLIKLSKAKVVLCIQPDSSLCQAGHLLKIPVYDFQHGVISRTMVYYGKDFNMSTQVDHAPNAFLCWDKKSAEIIDEWAKEKQISTYVIGNPWINRFVKKDPGDKLVQSELSKLSVEGNWKKRILITLQWGLDHFYPETFKVGEFIHRNILDAIRETKGSVFWFVRLHPVQAKDKNEYERILKFFGNMENVDLSRCSSSPLPLLLEIVDGHLTWDSSSVIEAANISKPSYIANPGYFSALQTPVHLRDKVIVKEDLPYSHYERLGYATRAKINSNYYDIIQWIDSIETKNFQKNELIFNEELLFSLLNKT